MKINDDPRSCVRNFSNCVENPENLRTSTGLKRVTSTYHEATDADEKQLSERASSARRSKVSELVQKYLSAWRPPLLLGITVYKDVMSIVKMILFSPGKLAALLCAQSVTSKYNSICDCAGNKVLAAEKLIASNFIPRSYNTVSYAGYDCARARPQSDRSTLLSNSILSILLPFRSLRQVIGFFSQIER